MRNTVLSRKAREVEERQTGTGGSIEISYRHDASEADDRDERDE